MAFLSVAIPSKNRYFSSRLMRVPEKILVIRFSSIGDILLATPLLRVLREKFPDAQIDFLIKSEFAELVKYNPHLSSVIQFSSDAGNELSRINKQIRAARYDVLLDLHNSLRTRWLRSFSRARKVRVVDKRVVRRFLLVKRKKNYYGNAVHVVDRYVETAAPLGVHNDGMGLEVHVPEDLRAVTRAKLARHNLDASATVIGIVPGARHFTKRWPQERFVEFGVKAARTSPAKFLLFGGKAEADYCADVSQLINAACGSNAAVSLAGQLSLLETAVAFDACGLVVTNDTGLMHLAAARKRKIVAIFGSTVKEFGFTPYGTENIVVENSVLSCRPCSHIGLAACPEGHFRCMVEISSDEVEREAHSLLIDNSNRREDSLLNIRS